jgi:hypothetical protein
VTYRAELSDRVLGQLGHFPAEVFDALIAAMSSVVEYPDDPIRTFPTADPGSPMIGAAFPQYLRKTRPDQRHSAAVRAGWGRCYRWCSRPG